MWSQISQSLSLSPWYATPQGAYALAREKILLQHALSPWPRRGHSLLDMGCGDGLFLEFFWQSGFDVTAIDRASPLLDAARQRLHGRADIQAGALDSLPFADNTFDYVAITAPLPSFMAPVPPPKDGQKSADSSTHSTETDTKASKARKLSSSPNNTTSAISLTLAHDILHEAVRVSAKGLILRCWNPFSLAGLWRHTWLCPSATLPEQQDTTPQDASVASLTSPTAPPLSAAPPSATGALWLGWRDYRALLRTLSPGCAISTRSTLCGPPPTWHPGKALRHLNEWESPLPLGAVVYLRVRHQAQCPFTALPLRLSMHLKSQRTATAMERREQDEHI